MRRFFFNYFCLIILLFLGSNASAWSPYFELGSSLGKLAALDQYFGLSTTGTSSNLGFCGSFNFYVPVTSPKNFFHFELGLQNRMYFVSTDSPKYDLAMLSTNIAMRFEFSRFYVGGGYSPFSLAGTDGPLSMKSTSGASSYFLEGGLIWRVVPELQIAATFALETGLSRSSPSPGTEYGLRFRFPISPYSHAQDASGKFDGFRYPFGVMK